MIKQQRASVVRLQMNNLAVAHTHTEMFSLYINSRDLTAQIH